MLPAAQSEGLRHIKHEKVRWGRRHGKRGEKEI
jgi:hypothetical protein